MNKRDVLIFGLLLMLLVIPAFVSSYTCVDYDNGNKPYEGSFVRVEDYGGTDDYYDVCSGNVLTEQICTQGGSYSTVQHTCTNGCITSSGGDYCESPNPCTDSDGGGLYQEFIEGNVTGYSNGEYYFYEDTCLTTSSIKEYYCEAGQAKYKTSSCGSGNVCSNGACVENNPTYYCEDNENPINDPFTKGTVSGNTFSGTFSQTDRCDSTYGEDALLEFYCTENNMYGMLYDFNIVNCENGCSNGACIEGTSLNAGCYDDDPQNNPFVFGNAYRVDSSGVIVENKDDKCIGDTLKQYYCTGYEGEPLAYIDTTCENVCSNGACVEEGTTGGTTYECIDRDGGSQPYIPGYVDYAGKEYRDSCNSNTLTEYYCDSGQARTSNPVKSLSYVCPRGYTCSDYLYQSKNYGYCKPTSTGGNTVSLLNGKWIKTNVKPESELFSLSLTESQLGTTASKVGLKVTKSSSTIGTTLSEGGKLTASVVAPNPDEENTVITKTGSTSTTTTGTKTTGTSTTTPSTYAVIYDIYELDKLPTIEKTVSQVLTRSTNSFLSLLGRVIGTVGSNPGSTSNYLNFPTHIKTVTGTMTNNEAIVYWTITESDVLKAGSENSYQFYFKAKVGNDENSFLNKILTVNVDWSSGGGSEPPTPVDKRWLDNDKTTVITKKSINWYDLTPTTKDIGKYGSQTSTETNTYSETKSDTPSITGNLVIGDSYLNYKEDPNTESNTGGTTTPSYTKGNKNLLYMDASNLGVAPGTLVYFNVYEKDSHEVGEDDPIRVGSSAIRVSADQSKRAIAPLFLSQDDVLAASTSDGREINENNISINLELYYEVVSFNKVEGQTSGFLSQIKQTPYDSFATANAIADQIVLDKGTLALEVYADINGSNWASQVCEDSDGGFVYDIKGTVTSTIEGTFTDSCVVFTANTGGTLQEYACEGDNVVGVMYDCPLDKPCVNGACGGTIDTSVTDPETETNKTGYLANSEGVWKDKNRIETITEFDWSFSNDGNLVTAFVSNIPSSLNGQDVKFAIWEDDSTTTEEDKELTDGSVSETFSTTSTGGITSYDYKLIEEGAGTVSDGEVYFTWDITKENLDAAAPEEDDRYEFYFGIKLQDGESKIFKNKILYVYADGNVVDTCGNGICESWEDEYTCPEDCSSTGGGGINGTGDECDNVNYCADHLSQNSCENPCPGALENDIQLNNEVDCSNESIDCACAWVNDECAFVYNEKQEGYGSCLYINGEIIDNCYNTGTLIMTYEAIWNWNVDNCYESKIECEDAFGDSYSFGTKCLDREGCWRQADSSYDECRDYQETKECSSGGEINDDDPIVTKSTKKWYTQTWFYIVLAILIILLILAILWFLLKKKNKTSKEERLFKNKNNLYNIMNYINNVKRKGMPDDQIRANLRKSGWKPEQIKYAMKKYSGKKKRKFNFKIFGKSKKTPVK